MPAPPGEPAGALQSTHRAVDRLCDMLEAVADSLPAHVDRRLCHRLADELAPSLKAAQEFEELQIFPPLRTAAMGRASVLAVLERLEYEHFEDLCFAEEASEVLRRLANGGQVNTEALGYMLRGLFSALRRHMMFEQEFVRHGAHG
ncbi:hypothetical protein TM49_17150 [Martelella endophytica]|uniref:Hemerythrin-like domain-containing protein n=1 Tax=Martelella endophytica TaxID=1486262 RepID=A0A0D5LVH1_MAREN|nr:hypothetical protein TM49_17150 [Martelella endophytica]